MDKNALRELVKTHFKLTDASPEETHQETVKAKFDTATLVDGTVVKNDSDTAFEVGQTLFVETAEGETVTAPEGAHVTESGIEIVVDSQGVITEINHPDQQTEMAEGEDTITEEMSKEETVDETAQNEESADEFAEHEIEAEEESSIQEEIIKAIGEIVAPEIEAMKTKLAQIEESMKEHYAKTPATAPSIESKFAKMEELKKNAKEGNFSVHQNLKQQQYQAVLAQLKNKK